MKPYQITATAEAENTGDTYEINIVQTSLYNMAEKIKVLHQEIAFVVLLLHVKSFTLRMYANRKGWSVDLVKAKVELTKTDDGRNAFRCDLDIQGDITS